VGYDRSETCSFITIGLLLERTIAIGLDGVSWNILDPLLDTGRLPRLAELRERGSSGVLESTVPFFTGAAWASFATGASPGAHGIYDFMTLRADLSLSVAHQGDLRRPTYYQHLGHAGRRSVLVNMPLDQFGSAETVIVNSWLTDDPSRRILPVGRKERYAALLEPYKVFPDNPHDVDELCAIEQARFDLARELFLREDWEHFFCLFSSTDWLGHAISGRLEAGDEEARRDALKLYEQIDGYLGWFADNAPEATFVVLSDHGQTGQKAVVRVNQLLRDLGYATAVERGQVAADPFFVSRRQGPRATIRVPDFLSRHRGNPLVRPLALAAKKVLRRGLDVQLAAQSMVVDRRASRAFMPTDASFAVYLREGDDEDRERIREALLAVRLPDGSPAIDEVATPDELFGRSGPGLQPSLLFSPAQGVQPSATVKDRLIDFPPHAGRGCHQRDGIVMIAGANTVAGDIGRASIYDLAPTLLWSMGEAVPRDGDGRVLFEAFDAEFVDTHPLNEVDPLPVSGEELPTGDSVEVTARLRALGYI
jgi:predicted AlkP superfamily phosphohydrolase/phosphomutase